MNQAGITIAEIIRLYVENPCFRMARLNRKGRAPQEDAVTISFIESLESICRERGIDSKKFRESFCVAVGKYPEYKTGGLSLSEICALSDALGIDPGPAVSAITKGT